MHAQNVALRKLRAKFLTQTGGTSSVSYSDSLQRSTAHAAIRSAHDTLWSGKLGAMQLTGLFLARLPSLSDNKAWDRNLKE
jgi:hypothetical protein